MHRERWPIVLLRAGPWSQQEPLVWTISRFQSTWRMSHCTLHSGDGHWRDTVTPFSPHLCTDLCWLLKEGWDFPAKDKCCHSVQSVGSPTESGELSWSHFSPQRWKLGHLTSWWLLLLHGPHFLCLIRGTVNGRGVQSLTWTSVTETNRLQFKKTLWNSSL